MIESVALQWRLTVLPYRLADLSISLYQIISKCNTACQRSSRMLRSSTLALNKVPGLGSIVSEAVVGYKRTSSRALRKSLCPWTKIWPNYNPIHHFVACPPSLTAVSTCGPRFFHPRTPLLRQTNVALSAFPFPSAIFAHNQAVSLRQFATVSTPNNVKMGSVPHAQDAPTVRVFIAGGSYAGLSAAVNLLDLGQGLSPRMFQQPYEHHPDLPRVNWDITIVDERDGFCKLTLSNRRSHNCNQRF